MSIRRFAKPKWLLLLIALGYGAFVGVSLFRSYRGASRDSNRIRHIVASEELILELNPELHRLARSVENLTLPDYESRELFAERVDYTDVQSRHVSGTEGGSRTVGIGEWAKGEPAQAARGELALWRELLGEFQFFEHAKFYFVNGHFTDESFKEFVAHVGFRGLGQRADGTLAGVRVKQTVTWQRIDDRDSASTDSTATANELGNGGIPAPEPREIIEASSSPTSHHWEIVSWRAEEATSVERRAPMFAEVLDAALPDPAERARARRSEHEEAVIEFYRGGAQQSPWPYFSPISANQRPGISVVDIDADGFDDLYVMVRRGRNQLLRNRGDGTFEEVAARWGLDVQHNSSCGIFADFDNDGDPDLMLGRSVEPSLYFENDHGHFVQRPALGNDKMPLPALVTSMSASDFNQDGLLDVYFCTYRPAALESIVTESAAEEQSDNQSSASAAGGVEAIAGNARRWTDEFLTPEEASRFAERERRAHEENESFGKILDQVGPPNVLLVNQGNGRFAVSPFENQVSLWRNSLQATWSDYDNDGDPDLYYANDWAEDTLLRNDGRRGFTDVTVESGITQFGFGMGVTWGDYDLDGRHDVYVSNMYSKAGRRITSQIADLNPSYGRSVDGNYLYKNTPDGFRLVSGLEPPQLTVAEAGWSWGGQFADFDNDGLLDIYALSGYFSAPREFESQVDL
ncbi:MAG: VCBS repeat-containing protein [Planctomycetales bacterium]|nr:VCBS repeat-containing protein [Planctomycetales bacterium]